jgi:LacI family gluconate utilization system Gnt-I transcriptional repressor
MGREVPTAIVKAPASVQLGRQAFGEVLGQDPLVQAVFCSSGGMAQRVLIEAQVRGIRVPEELAVLGFGGAAFSAHLSPSLSTVQVDGAAIGVHATELILARCQGKPVAWRIVDIGFQIVERESPLWCPTASIRLCTLVLSFQSEHAPTQNWSTRCWIPRSRG